MGDFDKLPDSHRARSHPVLRPASPIAATAALAMLAACASPQPDMSAKGDSNEYFAESEYGVKASPRVTAKQSRLPRGGGREQVGKPYQIKGKWYYPEEDPDYRKIGAASWYGDAFHGRLTANGEIYDMTHLTAAHPTMPLPSYARVTNVANGSSVVVRVNDRGPFANGRIIDLSKRAAEMLDYTHAGVAKVEVEYLGRAPLHGRDDQYLMASYRPGGRGPVSDEIEPPVMIAMNGPTPLAGIGVGVSFPGQTVSAGDPVLPALGPIGPERPMIDPIATTAASRSAFLLSYADMRIEKAAAAFAALSDGNLSPADIVASWKRRDGNAAAGYVAVGAFPSLSEAQALFGELSKVGRVELEGTAYGAGTRYAITLHADGRHSQDEMLKAAWAAGAAEAITVRD